MQKRGSITIYAALALTVLITVLSGLIWSVKVQAGRMEAANAAEQALFSLLAHYDRELFADYGLLFVDGGCGTAELRLDACGDFLEDSMSFILRPNRERELLGGKNLLDLSLAELSFTGYTLATDLDGRILAEQAISCMKDTGAMELYASLRDRIRNGAETASMQKEEGTGIYEGGEEIPETLTDPVPVSPAAPGGAEEAGAGGEGTAVPAEKPDESWKEVLPAIIRLRQTGFFQLAVPDASAISDRSVKRAELLSGRHTERGIGVISMTMDTDTTENHLLLAAYLVSHLQHYGQKKTGAGLQYQLEYLIGGSTRDADNLERALRELLLLRCAANILSIYRIPEVKEALETAANSIALLLLQPELESVLLPVLASGWALAESIVDIRGLLSGKRIPAVKSSGTWQVNAKDIPVLFTDPDSLMKGSESGISYPEYLGVLLVLRSGQTLRTRMMDMIECAVRGRGRADFRLDHCLDAVAFEASVRSEGSISLKVTKDGGYRQ